MRTKLLLSTLCAVVLSFTCSGVINPSSIALSEKPLSNAVTTELLGKVYMHHKSLLSNAEVKVFDFQTSERFTSEGNIMRTILLCSVKHEKLPTEYYAVTFNGSNITDGTLLGHDGDSEILKLKFPHDEMIYKPNPSINFEFKGDTIKVLRTYRFFSTARGGRWFEKEGTICNPFVVSSGGTIYQLSPTATAVREDGDANYLSEDHKQPTFSNTDGEFFPIGMNVLTMAQTPANNTPAPKELNKEANKIAKIVEQYKEEYKGKGDPPKNPETLSVIEFAKWSFNVGMRNSKEFLTWVAKNPKEDLSKFFIIIAGQNESNELLWLKDNVKNLKDKKARKWWEKWIKENL